MLPGAHLTTQLVWISTGFELIMDVALACLAWRFVNREQLAQRRWLLVAISGLFFLLVWTSAMLWGWDWFYTYIFPGWARYLLPPVFGIGYALLALGIHWICLKLPGNAAVNWCLLGGLEGLLSHIYAIYGLGAVAKPPIMQGTDPLVVLIFAIFEKMLYWSLILLVSRLFMMKDNPRMIHKHPL